MQFKQTFQFISCVFIISAFTITSACKKDNISTTDSIKCDYAPYSIGSKFVYSTSGSQNQTATDTIIGDTTINGMRYAKKLSVEPDLGNNLVAYTTFIRCDANGIFILIDRFLLGLIGASNISAKEIQSIKLPASVGLSWKSDTIKYTNQQGASASTVYKMQEISVGGTKTHNGTTYSNNLVTVQIKAVTTTLLNGSSKIDSSTYFTTTTYDKNFGVIEASGSIISKSLKNSTIK